jgi:hypothetical protein
MSATTDTTECPDTDFSAGIPANATWKPIDWRSGFSFSRNGNSTLTEDACFDPENVRNIGLAVRSDLHHGDTRHSLKKRMGAVLYN